MLRKKVLLITMTAVTAMGMIGCGSKTEENTTAPVSTVATEEESTPEEASQETTTEEESAPEEISQETAAEDNTETSESVKRIVDEARNIDADGDLMDYFGKNIDELMPVFPKLEIMSQEGEYDKNGAQYGDKEESYDGITLSGPFFDVDKDSNIVGISYGGRRFVLEGICAAVDMKDAIDIIKEKGWQFSDVEITHGTAQYVGIYTKDDMILSIVTTADGNTNKMEESDLTGFVESVSITKKK